MDSTDKYHYWNRVRGGKRPHVTEKTHLRQGKNARLDREEQNLLLDYCICNWKNKHFESYLYLCMYVCMCVGMYACLCVCAYVCVTFIHPIQSGFIFSLNISFLLENLQHLQCYDNCTIIPYSSSLKGTQGQFICNWITRVVFCCCCYIKFAIRIKTLHLVFTYNSSIEWHALEFYVARVFEQLIFKCIFCWMFCFKKECLKLCGLQFLM